MLRDIDALSSLGTLLPFSIPGYSKLAREKRLIFSCKYAVKTRAHINTPSAKSSCVQLALRSTNYLSSGVDSFLCFKADIKPGLQGWSFS